MYKRQPDMREYRRGIRTLPPLHVAETVGNACPPRPQMGRPRTRRHRSLRHTAGTGRTTV